MCEILNPFRLGLFRFHNPTSPVHPQIFSSGPDLNRTFHLASLKYTNHTYSHKQSKELLVLLW